MADERNEEQFNQTEGKAEQQPTDQQRAPNEFGQQPSQPEMMSGEGKFGGQSSSGDAEADTDILQADRTTTGGSTSDSAGEGFIGSQGSDASAEDDSDVETGQASRLQDDDADIEGSSGAA